MSASAPLLVARGIRKSYGPKTILNGVDISVHEGERIGLVGPNGSGKSTLARILAGEIECEEGEVTLRGDLRVGALAQEPRFPKELRAVDIVLQGLESWMQASEHHTAISEKIATGDGDLNALMEEQAKAAEAIERMGGWGREREADAMLDLLNMPRKEAPVGELSGGERRRVALAKLLVQNPELLFLDEPTNHLDVETIEGLEHYFTTRFRGTLVVVTHDRAFLDRVVTRTIELDRGDLFSYDGGWSDYLEASAERESQQERVEANRQRFLKTELEWLRRSPKARTTKQKARIQRAHEAMDAVPVRRQGLASFQLTTQRLGKEILELKDLKLGIAGRTLIDSLSLNLLSGQRIGIIGPNGAGKTSLLNALLGNLKPLEGKLKIGKNTRFAYLDQSRGTLDDGKTLLANVSEDGKHVTIGGADGQTIDARAYLARFLFPPDRMRERVAVFSGGERARVALAKLLLEPANVILLDEPTNDLDVQTLSSLEQMILEAQATAIVVSHDRFFLDRIATHLLVFDGDGTVTLHAGGYSDYRERVPRKSATKEPKAPKEKRVKTPKPGLSYHEKKELSQIEKKISTREEKLEALEARLADPALYTGDPAEAQKIAAERESVSAELEAMMLRWEELEEKKAQGES